MDRFNIVNTARSQHTRMARTAAPGRARMKQHVGGELRVLRSRPLQVSEEVLMKHIEELKEKQRMGHLEVRTTDGRLVNLEDMSVGAGEPKVLPPHVLLDSAKNDKNLGVGESIPQFAGGIPVGAVVPGGDTSGGIPGVLEAELPSEEESLEEELSEGEQELSADAELTDPVGSKKNKKKGNR